MSMATRKEITKKYARAYASAARKEKGRLLDELVRGHGVVQGQRPAVDRRGGQAEGLGAGGGALAAVADLRV